jgi:hypothetical protein
MPHRYENIHTTGTPQTIEKEKIQNSLSFEKHSRVLLIQPLELSEQVRF